MSRANGFRVMKLGAALKTNRDEKKRGCICMLNRVTINSAHDPNLVLF